MSYTATWILILISWLILWRFCAHHYFTRGMMVANAASTRAQAPVSGPQMAPAVRSAQPGTPADIYAPVRSEAIQGLVGLGWRRQDCVKPVRDAQAELQWAGADITTESLLRAVLARRAAELRA